LNREAVTTENGARIGQEPGNSDHGEREGDGTRVMHEQGQHAVLKVAIVASARQWRLTRAKSGDDEVETTNEGGSCETGKGGRRKGGLRGSQAAPKWTRVGELVRARRQSQAG
jgi:hypothetical protein